MSKGWHRLRHLLRAFEIFSQWAGVRNAVKHYWWIYGGLGALLRSPYIHSALLLTIVAYIGGRFSPTASNASDIALSAIPNLLGFTVGALAIVLAFSSADIFSALAEKGEPQSFFMKMTASLVHFIAVQALTLIVAILAKITGLPVLDIATLFLLFYAVLVTFAAGVQLYNTAIIYNAHASLRTPAKKNQTHFSKRPISSDLHDQGRTRSKPRRTRKPTN